MDTVEDVQEALSTQRYVADTSLSTAIFLSLKLPKPLLLEGEAGVGKTEVAKVLASILQTDLIRLQCYEGLDISHAVYDAGDSRRRGDAREPRSRHAADLLRGLPHQAPAAAGHRASRQGSRAADR
jgi:MoxR-like ATPase